MSVSCVVEQHKDRRWLGADQFKLRRLGFSIPRPVHLDVGDPSTPCVHEVEVQAEQVFAVRATTCPAGKQVPQTVTALFADVERFVHVRYWVNGVGCDYLAPDMTYDPERGFPTHFRATQQPAPRWMPMLAGGCTMVAAQEPGWTVLHLEPLP